MIVRFTTRTLTGVLVMFLAQGCIGADRPLPPEEALQKAQARIDRLLAENPAGPVPLPFHEPSDAQHPLQFWYFTHPLYAHVDRAIRETNPPLNIDTLHIGDWTNAVQKLTVSLAASTPPDLALVDRGLLAPLVYAGRVQPLDDVLPREFLDTFVEGILNDYRVEGKLYALPADGFVSMFVVDSAQTESIPETWEELQSLALSVKSKYKNPPIGYLPFLESLWSAGGHVVQDNRPTIDSQAGLETLTYFNGLVAAELTTPVALENPAWSAVACVNGEIAMTSVSSAEWSSLRKARPTLIPTGIPGKDGPIGRRGATALVLLRPAAGERKEFVRRLCELVCNADFQSHEGNLPLRQSAEAVGFFASHSLRACRATPLIPMWNAVESEVSSWVSRVYRRSSGGQ
ncbi:MAG: hypothetical protein AMXMBFR84_41080 [Candidatus Hydrogenedentota bacterium]